MIFSSHYF
uniref:Uncharacterized protein n=1 Tax=Oryza punctata TaxID=4537 RepID=A0A0G2KBQ3_ORYPU